MNDRETGNVLMPRWDSAGLVTAVVTHWQTGEPLMVAHMDSDALDRTIESGEAWFWSRSRGRLWRKGETSGHVMKVVELRVDCDQDAIWLRAEPLGPACHPPAASCFYRRLEDGALVRVG